MTRPMINKTLRFTTPAGELQVVEQEIAPLPPNEILVKVHAASINPVDTQLWRSQVVGVVHGNKGMGRDFSGTVVEVGSNVKDWNEGDDVFGLLFHVFGQGTFSQYVNVNTTSDPVVKKPSCLSHEVAASLPLVALTAFACLDWLPPPVSTPRRVIIRGASGGTGSLLVQLAKSVYDCHVTAICSAKNSDYVKKLGADEVIDYSTQPVVQTLLDKRAASQESDLIVDCVGGLELLGAYTQLLHKKGAYVTIVGDKTSTKSIGGPVTYMTSPAQIFRYIRGWIWGPRYACVSLYTEASLLQKVVGLAERGELHFEIHEVIKDAFDEEIQGWRRAIELIESARVRGKVILEIPQ